jgi:hypothetical protein
VADRSAYYRAYYRANREKLKAYNGSYYEMNRAHILSRAKESATPDASSGP